MQNIIYRKVIILLLLILAIFLYFNNRSITIEIACNENIAVDTLEDAYNYADYIVKGHFRSYITDWNMYRDDEDITIGHSYKKMIGKIYSFQPTDIYKGDNDMDPFLINLKYEPRIFYNQFGVLEDKNITNQSKYVDHKETLFQEPKYNQEYILFLNYDKDFDFYYPAFYPYAIVVEEQDLKLQTYINEPFVTSTYYINGREIVIKEELNQSSNFMEGMSLHQLEMKIIAFEKRKVIN